MDHQSVSLSAFEIPLKSATAKAAIEIANTRAKVTAALVFIFIAFSRSVTL
jgi:hypothetical protein